MAKPPLLGFNNNVRHYGRIFHIQTEDSGVKYPRIVTHLFADGGRIIKTARTDYSEHVGRDDMATVVRALMKEQHKAMFVALRAGELDELLGDLIQKPDPDTAPVATRPDAESSAPPVAEAAVDSNNRRSLSNPSLRKVTRSVRPPAPDQFDLDVASLDKLPSSQSPPGRAAAAAAAATEPEPEPAEHRYAEPRPAAIFGDAPPSESIFGGSVISEKSLDEVILSYLAEDLEEGSPE